MIIANYKRLLRILRKTQDYYEIYGARETYLEMLDRLKFKISKKKHDYRSVLDKFPKQFNAPQVTLFSAGKWVSRIDSDAQDALQELLARLNMSIDARALLRSFKAAFIKDKYYQMLEDLFAFEHFITAHHSSSEEFPIIQTSKLPEVINRTRRRRILFITSQFPNPYNGGGNRVLNFIKILSKDNDVYLSTSFIPDEDGPALQIAERYCHSIQTIRYRQFGGNQASIHKWLNGVTMDIVHYEWPLALENYDPAYGKYHIFTYMEAISLRLLMDIKQVEPLSIVWLEKFAELIYALRLELADAVLLDARIAVTTKDGNFFKELFPYMQYSVLNHGLTFDEFSLPDVEPEPHTLVFVGNYKHYPNMDAMELFFNEIWPALTTAIPDIRIYLVGPNPPEKLRRYANDQRIILTGGVPDIRPYIQKASIGIAPLITGAGMRGKVIDYAAMRRTFVATSLAVTDLVFENETDFCCADTPPEFTQKIISLVQDVERSHKMSEAAFNTARENYDNYRLTDFLVRLYEHLEK